jgi:hypothetical protein
MKFHSFSKFKKNKLEPIYKNKREMEYPVNIILNCKFEKGKYKE